MHRKQSFLFVIFLISSILISCSTPPIQPDIPANPSPIPSSEGQENDTPPAPPNSDAWVLDGTDIQNPSVIFFNGNIHTIEDALPVAQAIAIQDDTIIAVGENDAVLALSGESTRIIDLQERTMFPGFIDSHVHRIGDRFMGGYDNPEASIQLAIQQGYTSMNEMFVDQGRLDELRALDQAGILRLRVNAYLPLNYDEPKFGNWYQEFQPGEIYSPYLRLAGLKIFMDHGWGKSPLLWTQDELDQTLKEASALGWQIAAHAVGESAHTMLLNSIEHIEKNLPSDDRRFRIEHVLVISSEDIQRMVDLNVLASIQLHGPNSWAIVFDDFYPEVSPDLFPNFTRYRDLANAGVFIIGSSDWPWGKLDQDFGSPLKMLNQAATRLGPGGRPPENWMLGQEIPIELALRSLTINGAYGTFEEDIKGSIMPGKLADLVILSEDPLKTSIDDVPNIQVLMTMIGGKVEWCAPGSDFLCPSVPIIATDVSVGSLPIGHVDKPSSNETISGNFNVFGWALDDDGPIDRVEIYLDGEYIGDAAYGVSRPDVANDYPDRDGSPDFGYTYRLDTTRINNGAHTLKAQAVGPTGDVSALYPEIVHFKIQN